MGSPLDQLVAASYELVRRRRQSRRDDVEDVAQDACVHVLRLTAPQAVRQPTRYLARIARNLLIDRSRRRKREAALFDSSADAGLVGRDSLDPERITSDEQTLMRALAAIEALPPRCREAFELFRFEGLNYVAHRSSDGHQREHGGKAYRRSDAAADSVGACSPMKRAPMQTLPILGFSRAANTGNPGKPRNIHLTLAIILSAALGLIGRVYAQGASSTISSFNDLQLTYQVDRYTELADRGEARGETLFFYKCFVCHNHYAKGGPPLANLFRHAGSASGAIVDEQTVTALIKNGTATMPGYRNDLSDADIDDLVSYLKSADCCYEAETPPHNPRYLAATHKWPVPSALYGGAHGLVRDTNENVLKDVGIQLIAPSGVRITVFTNEAGEYEFPAMQTGAYVLRVATPLSYEPYERSGVWVEGHRRINEIVLAGVPQAGKGSLPGALPPTEEIASQLSGAELLWNLSGSIQEKTAFVRTCGIGCHDLQEVLRNRFDERSWRVIVGWMTSRGSGTVFVVRPARPTISPDAERVIRWLSRVRGPTSKDDPYRAFPRPQARSSANVVVTEYELPRGFLSIHEVAGDSKGDIWYTSHRTPYVGTLDSRTGTVREYEVPDIPGAFPGTYKVAVDRNGIVWFSQNWAHRLTRLDPATGEFRQMLVPTGTPLNVGAWGNFALAPDGDIWSELGKSAIVKMDPKSGRILKSYPLTRNSNPADNLISGDGRFWAGGAPTMGQNTGMILDIASGKMYETNSGDFPSSAARGAFDRNDNAWFGGHTGSIIEIVNEIDQGKGVHMRAFAPPTPYFPYSQFYSAVPDKNGEIWSAWLYGPGFVRFNPVADTWRIYDMPEPSAFARSTWVDDSTTPPTIWYPDYTLGILVRIQPRD